MAGSGARRITIEFLGKDVTAGKTANQVEGKYNTLGNRMNKVGKVAGAALAGGLLIAGAAAVKAGQAAADDEAAQSRLAQSLRTGAKATDGQIASTESWITAQGKALGVADDELRPALGKLATATGDVDKAQRLAALGMDIAAGSGKDLGGISQALAKAYATGNVTALGKYGVATKDAAGKTKSLAEITKELAGKYQGAAAKAAETTAGKQKKLTVQMGELQEAIGAKLLPVMAKLADWGLKTIDWMTKHKTLVKVLGGVLGGLVGTLYLVSKAMAAVNLVMSLNPIGLVVLAIAGLVAGLVIAYKKSETFRAIVDGAFRGVANAASAMWNNVIKPVFRFIITAWLNVAGAIINGAAKAFGWVPGIGPKLKAAATWFNEFKQKVNNQLDGIRDKRIKISTPGADTAISNLATIRRLMHDISSAKPMKAPKSGGIGVLLNPGQNARGTNNWRGGPTWVGEKGPELLDVPRGSRITPNNRAMAASGGDTYVFNISGALDANAVGAQLEQILAKRQRSTGRPLQFATAH